MLVVDLLHEFELGVWKALLTHLLRMLDSLKGNRLCELDRRKVAATSRLIFTDQFMFALYRYRQVPTFGKDTIRRFSKNVSEMKRIAARDFEDILQVCGGSI
jgi:hypothetical protein